VEIALPLAVSADRRRRSRPIRSRRRDGSGVVRGQRRRGGGMLRRIDGASEFVDAAMQLSHSLGARHCTLASCTSDQSGFPIWIRAGRLRASAVLRRRSVVCPRATSVTSRSLRDYGRSEPSHGALCAHTEAFPGAGASLRTRRRSPGQCSVGYGRGCRAGVERFRLRATSRIRVRSQRCAGSGVARGCHVMVSMSGGSVNGDSMSRSCSGPANL
jgi:hypothetical protein